jgi:hypothetical protein
MHLNEVSKCLGNLMLTDQIRAEHKKNTVYFATTDWKDKRRWVMKKSYFFMLCACVVLLAPGFGRTVEEEPHPEIALIDYGGNEISLESNVPYSPKNTCGECHDYDAITNAYHFQQGRTDADGNIIVGDDLDSRNPWLLSRGMYGKW